MPATQSAPSKARHSELFPKGRSSTRHPSRQSPWPTRPGDLSRLTSRRQGLPSGGRYEKDQQNAVVPARRPSTLRKFFGAFSLERSFTLLGFVVAALMISLFGLDLACGWPFRRASSLFDATFTVAGVALAYLSWDVFWDQVRRRTR